MKSGNPILAGVIGNPITHSLSPLIHTMWADRAGINGYYIPIEAPNSFDGFSSVVDSLRTIGFAGVNVTLPHKENAFQYADVKSKGAQTAGAANMLTFSHDCVYADNSDIVGFAEALKAQLHNGETIDSALVLGAGGAARGVVLALKGLGCKNISISNRTVEKAEALAEEFSLNDAVVWEDKESSLKDAHLLVNTTSLGMTGQPPLELNLSMLNTSALVSDIVYNPLQTPLLEDAHQANLRIVDGLAMLMHQAAPGFKQWFKGAAEVDDQLRAILTDELHRRRSS